MAVYKSGHKAAVCRTPRGDTEDWRGPPPDPLSQTVADIVDLNNGCRFFVGISW